MLSLSVYELSLGDIDFAVAGCPSVCLSAFLPGLHLSSRFSVFDETSQDCLVWNLLVHIVSSFQSHFFANERPISFFFKVRILFGLHFTNNSAVVWMIFSISDPFCSFFVCFGCCFEVESFPAFLSQTHELILTKLCKSDQYET